MKNMVTKILFFLGIGYLLNRFGVLKCLLGGLVISLLCVGIEPYGVNNGSENAPGAFISLLVIYGIYKVITK
tara:strand:- start:50 stop:265 length:216 start_codon:yes stop_codon:yes gene_type:complete